MKKITIIIMFVLTLLLSACSGSTDVKSNGVGITNSFNGGQKGLSLEFTPGAPPDKVRDQGLQPFNVRVEIKNEGEFDIEANSAFVALEGINPAHFGLSQTSQVIPPLNGFKKQGSNVIQGRTQQVSFTSLKYLNSLGAGTTTQKIRAAMCYPYQTKALVNICISGDALKIVDDNSRICDTEQKAVSFANSGAPVQIENVEQYPQASSEIVLQFDIVHKPTSEKAVLYERDALTSDCKIPGDASLDFQKKDVVTYTVNSGISGLKCGDTGTNSNTIQLIEDKYTVTCVQNTQGQEEYEKPVSITLDYEYLERVDTSFTVEHISR